MSTARGYSSTRDARELDPPPAGPAPGSGRPHAAEEVRVLRIRPGDRLVVTISEPDWSDPESASSVIEDAAHTVATWAGVERDAVLVTFGAKVDVLREDDR